MGYCLYCDKPLPVVEKRFSLFCTLNCKSKYRKETGIGDTTWSNELLVMHDLMTRGYQVFRSENLESCCDLIIIDACREMEKGGWIPLMVEVVSAIESAKGEIVPQLTIDHTKKKYDILAIVMEDRTIFYDPKLKR